MVVSPFDQYASPGVLSCREIVERAATRSTSLVIFCGDAGRLAWSWLCRFTDHKGGEGREVAQVSLQEGLAFGLAGGKEPMRKVVSYGMVSIPGVMHLSALLGGMAVKTSRLPHATTPAKQRNTM